MDENLRWQISRHHAGSLQDWYGYDWKRVPAEVRYADGTRWFIEHGVNNDKDRAAKLPES